MIDNQVNEFDEFVSEENVELAWERVRRSIRKEVKDWLSLKIYSYPSHIEKHLNLLLFSLRNQSYEPKEAYHFYRPKADRSLRRFTFLETSDRLVYQLFCNILISNSYQTIFYLNQDKKVFGNIPIHPQKKSPYVFKPVFPIHFGTSVTQAGQYELFRQTILQSYEEFHQKSGTSWLICTDIRSYFPSINHQKLIKLLQDRSWLVDIKLIDILNSCLSTWAVEDGKGIPVGYECSDYIGNLYLIGLDEELSNFTYHRYVDDMYVFVDNFEDAKKVIYQIDRILESLNLQRNTSKTEIYCIQDLPKERLEERLSKSLSQVAEEKDKDDAEQKRQNQLFELLNNALEYNNNLLCFKGEIKDIRQIAFVLYRLRGKNNFVEDLAYYVLDHYPNYGLHALTYLYQNYNDNRFFDKLKLIIRSEYEPHSLKEIAILFLHKNSFPDLEKLMNRIFKIASLDDWHYVRSLMRNIVEENINEFTSIELTQMLSFQNPFVRVYAYWLKFLLNHDSDFRCGLIDDMFQDKYELVKRLGIYLSQRYDLLDCVSTTNLDITLRNFLPQESLNDIEKFHKIWYEIFGIKLDNDFPIEKYFGQLSQVNQILRNIYSTCSQGADEFISNLFYLTEILLVNIANVNAVTTNLEEALDILDDRSLEILIIALKTYIKDKPAKNGTQQSLIDEFKSKLSKYFNKLHIYEGLRMRKNIFISYSHKDEEYREKIQTFLKPYFRDREITVWDDKQIKFGEKWNSEIIDALNNAKVAILLVSSDFLASDFIHEKELPQIFAASEEEGLVVAWIAIRPSSYEVTPLKDIQCVHENPKITLSELETNAKQERMLTEIAQKIATYFGEDI